MKDKYTHMNQYTSPEDMQFVKDILKGAPVPGQAWLKFDHCTMEAPSVIPRKYKELIAVGVALTTQCPYCIEKHVLAARTAGATQEEIAETILIAAALRSGAALGYGLLAMKLFTAEQ